MKIKCGKYDVFDSGSVINFDRGEPVEFYFTDSQPNTPSLDNIMCIRLIFSVDASKPQVHLEYTQHPPLKLDINCINWGNSLGEGTTVPLKVGQVGNRALYLSFRVYALSDSIAHHILYTWYLGEEVASGQKEGRKRRRKM